MPEASIYEDHNLELWENEVGLSRQGVSM